MKIKSLWVSEYKNLKDIDLTFDDKLINIMVGQNGLGKSNLIEIFALIFKDLYTIKNKRGFAALPGSFDYTIEYECRGLDIKIDYRDDNIQVYTKTEADGDYITIPFAEFRRRADELLPDRIMGYYSGENKRLEKMLSSYTRMERTRQRNSYRKGTNNKRMRNMFFSENRHSQLILFTLLMYWDHPRYYHTINKLLADTLDIDEQPKFEIEFQNPRFSKLTHLIKSESTLEEYRDRILNSGDDFNQFVDTYIFWGISGIVDTLLRLFLFEYYGTPSYGIYNDDKTKEYFWIKGDSIDDTLTDKMFTAFDNPVDFFDALEACDSIGSLHKLLIIAGKGYGDYFSFEALSEGEQQLISVLGLMAILRDDEEEVLYLIDEPDTHINPKWQRDFIDNLIQNIGDKQARQIFVSTHSPFLVQSQNEDVNILLFKNDNGDIKIDTHDHTIENWKIGQVLMSEYFDLPSTRPTVLDDFMKKRKEIISKGELTEADIRELKQCEDNVGFLPTGETISEIEDKIFIHNFAEEKRKERGE